MSKTKEEIDKIVRDSKKPPVLEAKSTPEIKLKDQYGRGGMEFNLREIFGFMPEKIVISKVTGRNNVIVVSAILTPEELEREAIQRERDAKKIKSMDKGSSKAPKRSIN